MNPKYRLQIKVPGTSANLGPGFDLLGLAFKIYNTFTFEFGNASEFKSTVKGFDTPPFSEKEDLVLFSYRDYFQRFLENVSPLFYSVKMDLELPMKGGLGSSASAVVAGYCAARFVHQTYFPSIKVPDEGTFLYHLAQLEGHPDNTTPAFIGGFVFSYFADQKLYYFKKKFPQSIHCYFVIPKLEISTHHSRKILPDSYPIEDIIFNMSRIGTWWEFLDSGKPNLLQRALEDKIHTPYRMNSEFLLNPFIQKVKDSVIGYSLSGSGPSVLLYCQRKHSIQVSKKLEIAAADFSGSSGIQCKIARIPVDTVGAVLTPKKI
ncbi:homoserine kinase [Leptospira perolatii]|uniref:Homoserine kinase n=1 Tax=Leptospira perolatii TaxID=2023191 RepID=A0A2M9ZJK6_9LEPT|nr:homoserine kinase [Leptospira perolatii]PJZ68583.1 homoserine kinase [Leptospira perolatii]PJZ72238.1 homoserine kinase [Leptospira perolatii]